MIAGQTRTLHPGQVLTIGRDPNADLTVDNPTVSRAHARLTYGERGWVIEDLGSTRGTFRDGKRITREDLRGSMAYVLGPPESGERLVIVAAGTAPTSLIGKARRSRNLALVAAATAIVAIVVVVAVVLVGRGDDTSAKLDVDDLRAATVRILTGTGRGSGTIVDGELGLILTNADVVRPDAPGQGVLYGEIESQLEESPAEVVILVSKGADEPAEPEYRGEVVAADGYLDLAVVRITKTYGGRPISATEDLGLPSVPIGDSTAIGQADRLTVFGFPGVADSDAAQRTDGAVSGFISDPRLSTNRAFINSDVSIAPGNSGGLAADEQGRLIGVPTSERSNGTDSFSRIRPIHLALDLIDAARDGTEYTSDFVTPAESEEISDVSFATDGPPFAVSCRDRRADAPGGDAALSIAFAYTGFPAGHQDALVTITSEGEVIGQVNANEAWPVRWDGEGCAAVTVPLFDPVTFEPAALQSGQQISIFVDVGPNYEKDVLAEQVVVP